MRGGHGTLANIPTRPFHTVILLTRHPKTLGKESLDITVCNPETFTHLSVDLESPLSDTMPDS